MNPDYDFLNNSFIKLNYKDVCIYYHKSLKNGIFYGGTFNEYFDRNNCIMTCGLLLDMIDISKLRLKTIPAGCSIGEEYSFMNNPKIKWTKIHPSDFWKNVFDGYRLIDLKGLENLKIEVNKKTMMNITPKMFEYFNVIGFRWMPNMMLPWMYDILYLNFSIINLY